MASPDPRRLALVTWPARTDTGSGTPQTRHHIGTGYFVTANLVLTASHVVPEDDTLVGVRVEAGNPDWRETGQVVWRDTSLDAALIRVDPPLPSDVPPVAWREDLPAQNASWDSTAYPDASDVEDRDHVRERKSAGLAGRLYVQGGGGQGSKKLELGVDDPPTDQRYWRGISGAPVFLANALVGVLDSTGYDGARLYGVPVYALMQNIAFRTAIAPRWLDHPRSGPWILVLQSEAATEDLTSAVEGSLARHKEEITTRVGQPRVVSVRVTVALETPERWLQFVEALCAAPIMIADVTGFEPGIMLSLGVRAVVRRGVTIASTANLLDAAEISALPFNIQETKLISHGDADPDITDKDPRFSLNIIKTTIVDGLRELSSNPRYLDLPAYDAVRCPAPELPKEQEKVRETVLVLCSFHEEYAPNSGKLLKALSKRYPTKEIVRMRDIISPRLVGQALYEHIRWTTTCMIDWTHWRANVFFEFGVRLACSKTEPVCLLQEPDASEPLLQKDMLARLFGPTRYALGELQPALNEALAAHERHAVLVDAEAALPRALERLPHNGTYHACLAAFDYKQDRIAMQPQDLLRSSVETLDGKDRQRFPERPVLFGSNPDFDRELTHSIRERWIAAWCYLRYRYSAAEFKTNARLRRELEQLGELLLKEVRDDPGDPSIAELRATVVDVIDRLDEEAASAEER